MSHREFMRQLLEELNVGAGQRVLDVGFGSPEELKALAERLGPEGCVLGIDIDPERVKRASAGLSGQSISVEEGSLSAIPAEDEAFDVVLYKGVLHEVRQLDRAFQELRRVTRREGGSSSWISSGSPRCSSPSTGSVCS